MASTSTPHQSSTPLKMATRLRKEGQIEAALGLLREALQDSLLTPEEIAGAGRLVASETARWHGEKRPLKVLLLGQCTLSWLGCTLTAVGWRHAQPLQVAEGAYDHVMQELMTVTDRAERPDVVVLVPWSARRLDGGIRLAPDEIEAEAAFWRQAQSLVRERLGSRIVQVGYDWIDPGAGGYHLSGSDTGHVGRIRHVNAALRRDLAPGAYFVDLEQVSGGMGRDAFYSPRRYHWTKQPFSEAGVVRLAEHVWAGIRAATTGAKKVLVLDLDNTLWGGVVGETGPHGITLGDGADGEAFQAFHAYACDLTTRGVLLAVASKNNPADAREPFTANREMLLNLDHFAAFEASWESKSVTIARIARTLNLGLDSFVFFDDNPVERAEVRHELPEVEVVEVPTDPAEYVRALQAGLWFEATELTDVDRQRVAQYTVERSRRELQEEAPSLEAYLQSLNLRSEIELIGAADLARVVQLLAKTNQFNLTTRRHTHEDLLRLLGQQGVIGLRMRAADRFGDYGPMAVMLGVPVEGEPAAVRIDTWLMSCRVIGRTFGQFMFGAFLSHSRALGYRRLLGDYLPTAKNALVKDLYAEMGCECLPADGSGAHRYALDLTTAQAPTTWVRRSEETGDAYGY